MIYKCLICFSVIYLLMLGFIVFKKFIKPRLEVEHYLDYSPFDPLNEDSESYKHENEKHYLYNQIQRKMLKILKPKIIKEQHDILSKTYKTYILEDSTNLQERLSESLSKMPHAALQEDTDILKEDLIELIIEQIYIVKKKPKKSSKIFNKYYRYYINLTYLDQLTTLLKSISKLDELDELDKLPEDQKTKKILRNALRKKWKTYTTVKQNAQKYVKDKYLLPRLKDINYEHDKLEKLPGTTGISNTMVNSIIKYLIDDINHQLDFIYIKNKTYNVNSKYKLDMILKLISVGYIERKVEEINTYFTSEKEDKAPHKYKSYIDIKIREYIKLMNVTGLFNTLIKPLNKLTRDQAKIKIIKEYLYKENNNTVTGYIYEQYIKKKATDLKGLNDITKIYTDISKTHNKYDPDIPVRELEVILKQIKIKNNTKFTLKNELDIFEKEKKGKKDIRYELKNERLIKEIIDNEIMKNINKKTLDRKSAIYKGHDDYINKKNKYSYRDTKSGIIKKKNIFEEEDEQKDLYTMFEEEYPETYKYLNHSITSFKKTDKNYKLNLNIKPTQIIHGREYIIKTINGKCKKSPSSGSEVNLCDPYLVEIELEIYKEYTNDVYKIHFELLVFDDYILPTFEEEETAHYTDKDNVNHTVYYNKYKNHEIINQYEDLIRNKIYIFEKYDILSTYRRDMYISNDTAINRNDDRLKYENYDKHYTHNHYHGRHHHISEESGDPHTKHNKHNSHRFHSHEHSHDGASDMQTKRSKYYGDPVFINKLLCEKKRKSEELLHNYILINDKFKQFSKDRTLKF